LVIILVLALQEKHATRIIHLVEDIVDNQHAIIAAARLLRKYNGRLKRWQRALIFAAATGALVLCSLHSKKKLSFPSYQTCIIVNHTKHRITFPHGNPAAVLREDPPALNAATSWRYFFARARRMTFPKALI